MCSYTGRHFGAGYEDACCIDGYLWDLDSCDEPGGGLHTGGDIPCPSCNTAEYLDDAKDDAEGTVWGRFGASYYTGAMLMEGALRKAEEENSEAADAWKKQNPQIWTSDWPDRQAVMGGRADPERTIEVTMQIATELANQTALLNPKGGETDV